MSNPYQSPTEVSGTDDPQSQVAAPAVALIAVAVVAIVFGALGLGIDLLLIVSGSVEVLERENTGPISEYTQIAVRTIWGLVLFVAAWFVLYGGWNMKNLTNYGTARTAAIVAMVPLVGPCCLLGIPFGLWAFLVLGKAHVRSAFRS
jgi:hypothetical protein